MLCQSLSLTYQDFLKKRKSLANTQIGTFRIFEKLGSGQYGSVYRGVNKQNGREVAVKVLDLAAIEEDSCSEHVKSIRRRLACTESEVMGKIKSPHVMKCYATFENKDIKIMVVQYCNGTTLEEEIFQRGGIPEPEAIQILKQIITGVAAMHSLNIVHRDLKGQNIMSHNGVYKIIDLGFAKIIPGCEIKQTTLGTKLTMAPEVMARQKYGLKADIWSLGVILYQMISGRYPFERRETMAEMYEQVISTRLFPSPYIKSRPITDLLKKMLVVEQEHRLNWNQLIKQPIFNYSTKLPEHFYIKTIIDDLDNSFSYSPRGETERVNDLLAHGQSSVTEAIQADVVKLKIKDHEQYEWKVDQTDQQSYKWAKIQYLQCLKAELWLEQVIFPIEDDHLFNMKSRRVSEMMYLLSSRCFLNLSFVKDRMPHDDCIYIYKLKEMVAHLYEKCRACFDKYSGLLTEKEDKVGAIIGDGFAKIFNPEKIRQKDRFLGGIENKDFSKEQQVEFTYKSYIEPLIAEMEPPEGLPRDYLERYVQINSLQMHNIDNTFAENVKKLVSQ